MHTQVARRQVALVLVPLETHPKIRILEQVMSLGDAFCRGRIESFQRDRKGAKKRCISRKINFSTIQSLSHVQLFAIPWTVHARPPWPSWTPRACSNSRPLNWWCHQTISLTVVPFSSCPQAFPASGSFQISQLFPSAGQSTGVSASTSVLPMSIQDRFPLGSTGCIYLQCKGRSRVVSNITVQKHQFFSSQLSL